MNESVNHETNISFYIAMVKYTPSIMRKRLLCSGEASKAMI